MKRIFIVILFLITQLCIVKSQIGNEFWFAAPDISVTHDNNGIPLMLHITAVHDADVTIDRPADDDFESYTFNLAGGTSTRIQLTDTIVTGNLDVVDVETYAYAQTNANFIQDKGYKITSSTGEIYVTYLPTSNYNNSDYASLKATNALGTNFWVSTQRKYRNHPSYYDAKSGFTIVAAERTTVSIDPNGNNLLNFGTDAPNSFTLEAGECVAFQAAYTDADKHIFGVHITSTGNIAVMLWDDSIEFAKSGGANAWNLFLDQTIPTDLIGQEYVVIRGETEDSTSSDPTSGEAVFVTPTVDGTDIYINGTLKASNLDAGAYFQYTISAKDSATYVYATKPVYVNHICGYSNFQTNPSASEELAGAVLPPVDNCTGSYEATVQRIDIGDYEGEYDTTVYYFNVNLIVRCNVSNPEAVVKGFTYSVNGGTEQQINPDHFAYIMDSAYAIYDRWKAGDDAFFNNVSRGELLTVKNSVSKFQMGTMLGRTSPGNMYAYYSDFAANSVSAGI